MINLQHSASTADKQQLQKDYCKNYTHFCNHSGFIVWTVGIKAFAYKPIVKADLAETVRKVLDEANS